MFLLILASLLASAFAACPNQCSGHGYCDENERCVCFRAPGTHITQVAYIGADCSQRVCPYGRSHDVITDLTQALVPVSNAVGDAQYTGFVGATASSSSSLIAFLNGGFLLPSDTGMDLRVVSVDTVGNNIKFQWKTSSQKNYYSENTAIVSPALYTTRATALHIRPDVDSGLYIYFNVVAADLVAGKVAAGDRYFLNVTANNGVAFVAGDGNSAHQNIECSGRGTCDRLVGACSCVAGYTGDACQRTQCPNDCSGHGICQSEQYFVLDASASSGVALDYAGFDANSAYGCKCDSGFRGSDCSQQECPSGPDPMKGEGGSSGLDCSGRGLCDYTSGVCKCFKGFFGERCEELSTLV